MEALNSAEATKATKELKIMQLNVNRCRAAHDMLYTDTMREGIDVILGQEPNKKLCDKYLCDLDCDTFIYTSDKINVVKRHIGKGFVSVELEKVIFLSVYFSPNKDETSFGNFLYDISLYLRSSCKETIIGGDFNAKMEIAGAKNQDRRGFLLEDWIASEGLIVINQGDQPTFECSRGSSIIDVTLATPKISNDIYGWYVNASKENMSDHKSIYMNLRHRKPSIPDKNKDGADVKKWRTTEKSLKKFCEEARLYSKTSLSPDQFIAKVENLCNTHFHSQNIKPNRQPVYWWNATIADTRKKCTQLRRKITRHRARGEVPNEILQEYKAAKKAVKLEILKSKRDKWSQLCNELENDIWGRAYKIATKRLQHKYSPKPDKDTVDRQIMVLFPADTNVSREHVRWKPTDIDRFSEGELKSAVEKLKTKKAAGPDCITAEILKAFIENNWKLTLNMYNSCLRKVSFPEQWKESRLVLIEKPKKALDAPTTFRPLCIMDAAGKIMELLIKERLQKECDKNHLISQNQYGFTKGKSTVMALTRLVEIKKEIKTRALQHQEFCVIVMLDIKNAFNTVRWKQINKALQMGGVNDGVRAMISSYLSDRKIVTPFGTKHQITCGVPQGSILGPLLWNIFYNKILQTKVEKGVELIAYADDLAVLVRAKTRTDLEDKTTYNVTEIIQELKKMELCIESTKTEMVIMEGRRTVLNMEICIEGVIIKSAEYAKYLGVYIDKNMRMTTHVKMIKEKANKITKALMSILPKVGGPSSSKRALLRSAVISTITYAAPAWIEAIKYKKYVLELERLTRKLAILSVSAYRTVSGVAVLAVAGLPPIELTLRERVEIHEHGPDFKETARKNLYKLWQNKWDEYNGWAKIFIENVEDWSTRKWGNLDYYTTQAITGHGSFGTYLYDIGKREEDKCLYCLQKDTPEHCIFNCSKYDSIRGRASQRCGEVVTIQNVGRLLMKSESTWAAVMEMMRKIVVDRCSGEIERSKAKADRATTVY